MTSTYVELLGCTLDANGTTYDAIYCRASTVHLQTVGMYNAIQGLEVYLAHAVVHNCKGSCTPYLIVDDSMVSALCLAAKSGVDVRIITPHIYDKALIHLTTRSFYRELIYGGVKIYEYSKGFMHSKIFVSDDQIATVGTTNLDFRSLYLHFECGVWMYNSKAVLQIKKDYFDTLNECTQITLEECIERLPIRVFQEILRIFAPLM